MLTLHTTASTPLVRGRGAGGRRPGFALCGTAEHTPGCQLGSWSRCTCAVFWRSSEKQQITGWTGQREPVLPSFLLHCDTRWPFCGCLSLLPSPIQTGAWRPPGHQAKLVMNANWGYKGFLAEASANEESITVALPTAQGPFHFGSAARQVVIPNDCNLFNWMLTLR